MTTKLQALIKKEKLPSHWAPPTAFYQKVKVGGVSFYLFGVSSVNQQGQEVTGSTAHYDDCVAPKALFEFLERCYLVDAISSQKKFNLLDPQGKKIGSQSIWKEGTPLQGRHFVLSKSNGVAIHSDQKLAMKNAKMELIERDVILRSWLGGHSPTVIENSDEQNEKVLKKLSPLYNWKHYSFTDVGSEAQVTATFGFPKKLRHPLIYGFGADEKKAGAIKKSTHECLQRLAFLWGEKIPQTLPPFSLGPLYHQEYYLYPGSHPKLINWLEKKKSVPVERVSSHFTFLDLSPQKANAYLIKAISSEHLDLYFGKNIDYKKVLKSARVPVIHPIC